MRGRPYIWRGRGSKDGPYDEIPLMVFLGIAGWVAYKLTGETLWLAGPVGAFFGLVAIVFIARVRRYGE